MIALPYDYYWFDKHFSKKWCDDVIKLGKKLGVSNAVVGEEKDKRFVVDKSIRVSKNCFLTNENWIIDKVKSVMDTANEKAGWNFDISGLEPMQFTVYESKEKGHYDWHIDMLHEPWNRPKDLALHNKVRKISMTINLSKDNSFEGGDFELQLRKHRTIADEITPVPQVKTQGSAIVFPSFVHHRVKPVTKGTRYSLVCWFVGAPFK